MPTGPPPPPSFQRDAVRLRGLRTHAQFNDCYGLVQHRLGKDAYSVRIGSETIIVKYANLDFVEGVTMIFYAETVEDAYYKVGIVLDAEMRRKYLPPTRVGGG